jgi:hypothetical protein
MSPELQAKLLRGLARAGMHKRLAACRFDGALVGMVVGGRVAVNVWATLHHRDIIRRRRKGTTESSRRGARRGRGQRRRRPHRSRCTDE